VKALYEVALAMVDILASLEFCTGGPDPAK